MQHNPFFVKKSVLFKFWRYIKKEKFKTILVKKKFIKPIDCKYHME